MTEPLLDVQDLQVSFATEDGLVRAVDGVSFTLDRGEVVAIVGESGSGKSVTVMTLMGLTRSPNARFGGSARLNGGDLVTASEQDLERVRGKEIAMIFQDPIASLSPVMRIGNQIAEQIRAHEKVSKAEALDRAADLMERVGIPRAKDRLRAYPHEFSGGMRQRVMTAMALSLSPGVLIADEPTTALDVTVQAQILELLKTIQQRTGAAMILITHDLGVVAEMVDNVIVMYAGQVVEQGTVDEVLLEPRMPYTMGLIESIPSVEKRGGRLSAISGVVPSPFNLPPHCRFEPRCPYHWETCRTVTPELYQVGTEGRLARCHLHLVEATARREAAIAQHKLNMTMGRRLTGAPDRIGDA